MEKKWKHKMISRKFKSVKDMIFVDAPVMKWHQKSLKFIKYFLLIDEIRCMFLSQETGNHWQSTIRKVYSNVVRVSIKKWNSLNILVNLVRNNYNELLCLSFVPTVNCQNCCFYEKKNKCLPKLKKILVTSENQYYLTKR